MDKIDIQNRFTYHSPKIEDIEKFSDIRGLARQMAYLIDVVVPEGREKSLAMTKLEEVVMWANAGIARR